jgi:hypothetical protein
MTEFLNSLKADLLDRRLLPLVALVAVGLVAAIAYVALDSGSSTSTPPPSPSTASVTPPGLTVTKLAPEKAVAETVAGVSHQRSGRSRNPFKPLPEVKEKSSKAKLPASSSSSTSTPSSPSSPPSSSGESGQAPVKPSTPAKPTTVYHAAVLFGLVPAPNTPEAELQLTPYENLSLLEPLPSPSEPLIIFRGVTSGGQAATFTVVSEAILQGQGKCLPSESQCEAIELKPGQAESLEYDTATGQVQVYDLHLVSITSSQGSSVSVESELRGESKASRSLLEHEGLVELPGLRYNAQRGVLVLAGHKGFDAHAHRR